MKIDDLAKNSEIRYESVLSSGPGGQNVNKNATAIKLYFNIYTALLTQRVKDNLYKSCSNTISKEGILVITAKRYKSNSLNKKDANERLIKLIEKALYKKKYRVATRPTKGSHKRRLEGKKKKSHHKQMRKRVDSNQD